MNKCILSERCFKNEGNISDGHIFPFLLEPFQKSRFVPIWNHSQNAFLCICPCVFVLYLAACIVLGCLYCPWLSVLSSGVCISLGLPILFWPRQTIRKDPAHPSTGACVQHFWLKSKGPWVPRTRQTPKGETDTQGFLPSSPP